MSFCKRLFVKALVSSYQSPFQLKPISSSQHKPELRPTKDFEAKYNKVKAKLALLSSSASASKAATVKNKCLIVEAYEWDEEEASSDDNKMVEVKVLMALAKKNDAVSKEGAKNGEWVKIFMRKYDIKKPIWYLDSGCSRHMTGVKSYLHKYEEQLGPKVVFGDDSTCVTEGYGSIKCNGIVFTKLAFVNGLQYNLISISQLCDAKYIVQFDEKRGTIFNSNKETIMIATRGKHHRAIFKTKQTSYIKKCLHLLHMDLFGPITPRSINHEKYTIVIVDEYSRNSIIVNFCDEKGISQNFSSPYTPQQNGVAERKNRTLIEAARTMLSGSVFLKQYWIEAAL
ncbi:retrovirus-related pol polyprotein from transposon TNT 1-94 [Tanacetum coccineum]